MAAPNAKRLLAKCVLSSARVKTAKSVYATMEAPQKRARDEAAATERPNKKYKCDPSLDTAAKQEDLSALSKPELRALVASARALARRADGEIAARHASFPRCLPPQFVMSWLPLCLLYTSPSPRDRG